MNPAAIPVPVEDVQGDGRWMSCHLRYVAEAKEKEPEVVFIGDSLVQHLAQTEVWEKMFEPLHCLNFGIGADQTQHVLWRIQNGEFDNISPKVVIVSVGTNNHASSADQVVGGILEIVTTLKRIQPQAQVMVVGIPPRGQSHNPLRDKIANINVSLAAQLHSVANVSFLNVDPSIFLSSSDGSISHNDMYDYLHFTQVGYQKLCEPILDLLQDLLKTFVKCESV